MNKTVIAGIVIFIVLAFLLGFFVNGIAFTGSVVKVEEFRSQYSYTKAICNSEKKCIDVLIECENGEIKKIEPVSDLTSFSDDWEDPRDNPNEELCF